MKRAVLAIVLALCSSAVLAQSENRITSKATAIEAAKRYMKTRCTAQAPCTFKAEHEGRQWRVWVRPANRKSGGTVVLYFDEDGSLKRRLEAD